MEAIELPGISANASVMPPTDNKSPTPTRVQTPEIPSSSTDIRQQRTEVQSKLEFTLSEIETEILKVEPIVFSQHPQYKEVTAEIRKVASEAMNVMRPYLSPLLNENSTV